MRTNADQTEREVCGGSTTDACASNEITITTYPTSFIPAPQQGVQYEFKVRENHGVADPVTLVVADDWSNWSSYYNV
jgi:hypothetical protein